jgi:Leucine-rich repeat (LRR) protein
MHLDLRFNQLSGEIPSSLGDLGTLHTLDLSFNQLSGEIPSSLGSTDLKHLSLQNNRLSGSFPSSFGKLDYLITIDLSSNQLSGSIPSSLVSLKILQELILNNNSLSGPVPELSSSELCDLRNNTDLCGHPEISNLCTVGLVTCNMDCRMMNSWLPKMFDDSTCCSQPGIGCIDERITNLYVSFKLTVM